jgi:hypothetical protein
MQPQFFVPFFAFLLVLRNALVIIISQQPFRGSNYIHGFEEALQNSSGYFYFASTFAQLPEKLRNGF